MFSFLKWRTRAQTTWVEESKALARLQKSFDEFRYQEYFQPLGAHFEAFVYGQVSGIPQHCLDNSRLYADRYRLIQSLPKNTSVAEIGVARGDFSEALIKALRPKYFAAVDTFEGDVRRFGIGRQDPQSVLEGKTHFEFYNDRLSALARIHRFELEIRNGTSWEEISKLRNEIDIFYVDAGHSFEEVLKDVEACLKRVTRHGFLVFNDYCWANLSSGCVYGVIPVVNALCSSGMWSVHAIALEVGMFCDICLQRVSKGRTASSR